ncbi:TonB-dependent receptor [Pseudovibrio sp. Tun.PSC04-5.I4]|uniref:TonB-dependent receptor domain-containing protein n=1 Tax=Pseudovibrio sp. Tun.PSC04-5.I4 TaxID=1798213 RepID=UPI000883F328|nr:TonB-dependent receptor [Pseudovibrio sp. Tun.PSC04-5.I4]SDR26026.1 hemoglobin/transferrin/lactoferrin receptor protein [Pseudovibrio sp. Tun.PSC04-5.I4]
MLDEIIVTAGKEKVAIDTPQAVTSVGQEEIEQKQASTIGEILDDIPGISVINADSILGQSLNIRGIGGALSSDENRIIIQVDGVNAFYEQYRAGSFFLEPEMFKEVEVLRGPASSTLYGAGALAGVVSMTTKDASDFLIGEDKLAVRTKTTWDSNGNGVLGSIIAAAKITDDLEFITNFNYRRAGDYDAAGGVELENSALTSLSGFGKLRYTFGADRDQSLWASYQHLYAEGDGLYDRTTLSSDFGTADQKTVDQQAVLGYENSFATNDLLDLKAQISFKKTHRELTNQSATFFGIEQEYTYSTWQGKLQNTSEFSGTEGIETYLTYGIEGQYQERLNPRLQADGSTTPGSPSHPEGESKMLGVFGQAEIVFDDRLTLIPGMRVDYSRLTPGNGVKTTGEASETAYSPKLAALYKVTDWLNIFGSVAHTERMPTIDEAFTGDGFTNLDKEKSNNIEAGFALSFSDVLQANDRIRLKTTVFYNRIDDYLYTTRDHVTGKSITTSIDEARLKGVELEAGYASNNWYGSMGATLTRGDNLTAKTHLSSVAADNAFLKAGYKFAEYNLDMSWRANFYAPQNRVEDADDRTPGYALHQVQLSWKPEDGILAATEIRGSITNIFDQKYKSHLSGITGKGRAFKLSLAKTF